MAVKRTGQLSLAEAFAERQDLVWIIAARSAGAAGEMASVREARWRACAMAGLAVPAWPPLVLFKALLLQSLYGLSDRELEEALSDRLSFRRFVGLGLEETIPDLHGAVPLPQSADRAKVFSRSCSASWTGSWRGRRDSETWHHAGCDADRGGLGAAVLGERASRTMPTPASPDAKGQGGFDLRLQGPCRCRSRLRADPLGDHHAGQCQRHGAWPMP